MKCSCLSLTALAISIATVTLCVLLLVLEIRESPDMETNCKIAESSKSNLARFKSQDHSAFVIGYTGEVGKVLVEELNQLKVFKKVVLIGRRKVDLNVGPEFEQKVVDFSKLDDYRDIFESLDVGFACMGTTRAKAGAEGFVKIDKDYPLKVADIAKSKGCKQYALVSSQGADIDSVFLYPKTKGETEEALKNKKFNRLTIYRPGLLLCGRNESRPMEHVARILFTPLARVFPTAITTPTRVVAMSMINSVISPLSDTPETRTLENKAIHETSGISVGCNKKDGKRKSNVEL